jgi:hypothetical protein
VAVAAAAAAAPTERWFMLSLHPSSPGAGQTPRILGVFRSKRVAVRRSEALLRRAVEQAGADASQALWVDQRAIEAQVRGSPPASGAPVSPLLLKTAHGTLTIEETDFVLSTDVDDSDDDDGGGEEVEAQAARKPLPDTPEGQAALAEWHGQCFAFVHDNPGTTSDVVSRECFAPPFDRSA